MKFQVCNLDLIVITRDVDGADQNFKPIFTIRPNMNDIHLDL